MTITEMRVAMARCIEPASCRVEKLSGRWVAKDAATMTHCPKVFKTKRAAIEWARLNASAVHQRLAEEIERREEHYP